MVKISSIILLSFILIVSSSYASTLLDSYVEANQSNTYNLYTGSNTGLAQSFLTPNDGNNHSLYSVKFYIKKTGSPTGNATAKLYNISGSFGTTSVPTGAVLATSNTLDVSSLTTSFQLIEMLFPVGQQYSMVANTNYTIVLEYTGGDGSNNVNFGGDDTSPTHAGNLSAYFGGSWTAYSGIDSIFYLYYEDAQSSSSSLSYASNSFEALNFTNDLLKNSLGFFIIGFFGSIWYFRKNNKRIF